MREFNRRAPEAAGKGVLLTRTASLAGLKPTDVNRLAVYTLRDEIVDGEDCLQEEGVSPQKQDLHAKVYFARKGKRSELYIGSANASHNALYGNVELMLRLQCDGDKLNLGKLKEELWDEENEIHPFRRVLPEEFPQDEGENSSGRIDEILRAVCEMGITTVRGA